MMSSLKNYLTELLKTNHFSFVNNTSNDVGIYDLIFTKQDELDVFLIAHSEEISVLGYFSFQVESKPDFTLSELAAHFLESNELPKISEERILKLHRKSDHNIVSILSCYLDSVDSQLESCLNEIHSLCDFGYLFVSEHAIKGIIYQKTSKSIIQKINRLISTYVYEKYKWMCEEDNAFVSDNTRTFYIGNE